MRFLRLGLRLGLGIIIGAIPGGAIYLLGAERQGIGISIIGGTLGLMIALTPVLYHTTSIRSVQRGFLLFLKVIAGYNIPGGEKFVKLDDSATQPKGDPGIFPASLVESRRDRGIVIGAITGFLLGLFLGKFVGDEPQPIVLEIIFRLLFAALVGFLFGVLGGALGAMTVSGLHRRTIIIGAVAGIALGSGLAFATAEGAKIPEWKIYAMGITVFGTLGTVAGLIADQRPEDEKD